MKLAHYTKHLFSCRTNVSILPTLQPTSSSTTVGPRATPGALGGIMRHLLTIVCLLTLVSPLLAQYPRGGEPWQPQLLHQGRDPDPRLLERVQIEILGRPATPAPSPGLLNRPPAQLQQRFCKDHPDLARTGKRERSVAGTIAARRGQWVPPA